MADRLNIPDATGVWIVTTASGARYAVNASARLIHRTPPPGDPVEPWDRVWIPWDSLRALNAGERHTVFVGDQILYWYGYIGGPRWQRSSSVTRIHQASPAEVDALPPRPSHAQASGRGCGC